jgi:hypothetical protein
MKVSLSSFSFGFLVGYARAPIGDLRLLGPLVRRFAMLVGDVLTALPQLPPAGRNSRPFTCAWQYQSKADQYQHDDDNHDDQRCGHQLPSSKMDAKRVPVARAPTNVTSGQRGCSRPSGDVYRRRRPRWLRPRPRRRSHNHLNVKNSTRRLNMTISLG